MKKIEFNIQMFTSADEQWFDEGQQENLISGISQGLNSLTGGTDMMARAVSKLSGEWHSPDAEKYGNPLVDGLKKFIPASRQYVASISAWMSSHGTSINVINGASVTFEKATADTGVSISQFSDNAAHRGLDNVQTAGTTKTNLTNGYNMISRALKQVQTTATSNPNAFPGGVVPNSLVPTVESENSKIDKSFQNVSESLAGFVEKLSSAINQEITSASSDASAGGN